jgi:hypothetical protein
VLDTGASRGFVTHGYTTQLAGYLSGRGLEAQPWVTRYEGEPEQAEMPAGSQRPDAPPSGDPPPA